jgi:hypothetical protein
MLATLTEKTAKLRVDLKDAFGTAERAAVVIQTFEGILKQLDSNLKALGHVPGATLAVGKGTAHLSTLYSMESERLIHEQTMAGKDASKLAATPKPPDPGNDVELF